MLDTQKHIQEQIKEIKSQYKLYKSKQEYHNALKCIDKLMSIGTYQSAISKDKLKAKWCRCQLKIGIDYWDDGNFEKSIQHMKNVINKDTTFAAPYYYIGLYHWFHHANLKAIKFIEKAVILKPNIVNYKNHLTAITNELKKNNNKQR